MIETDLRNESAEARQKRLQWFMDARYGMFVHWGIHSLVGREATSQAYEQIPAEEYEPLADIFNPKADWAIKLAKLAKKAGMRYMVLTCRHCDGYCLWDTKLTDYNCVARGSGRDLFGEFVQACRAEGLRVGVYYALTDMRHPDGVNCQRDLEARRRFVDYNHGQIRELLSNYGKIDVLWYDCAWPLYDEQMEVVKMNQMVHELQPEIIVNDRSGVREDYGTPECVITPVEGKPWESCMTFNEHWGYTPIDTKYKDSWDIARMLRQVAAGAGNFLLNVGPDPYGDIPEPCEKALLEVGEWLETNGPSIYEATDPIEGFIPIRTGEFTAKGNTLYFHCNRWPGTEIAIGGVHGNILSVNYLGGPKVEFTHENLRLVLRNLPEKAPSHIATVFEIKLDRPPRLGVPRFYYTVDDEKGWEEYWTKFAK